MKVALDNNILAWLLSDSARPPRDPNTNAPIDKAAERLSLLKTQVHNGDVEPLVIPMPVVAEFFSVDENAVNNFLSDLQNPLVFTLSEFGLAEAIELSIINNKYFASADKRGGVNESWQKIKTDRQIYAIAKVAGVEAVYTDDKSLAALCKKEGMKVVHSWELPLPDDGDLPLLKDLK